MSVPPYKPSFLGQIPEKTTPMLTTKQAINMLLAMQENPDIEVYDLQMRALEIDPTGYPEYARLADANPKGWLVNQLNQLPELQKHWSDYNICGAQIPPQTDLFLACNTEGVNRLIQIVHGIAMEAEADLGEMDTKNPACDANKHETRQIEERIVRGYYKNLPLILAVVVCSKLGLPLAEHEDTILAQIELLPAAKTLSVAYGFFLTKITVMAVRISMASFPFMLLFNNSLNQNCNGPFQRRTFSEMQKRNF